MAVYEGPTVYHSVDRVRREFASAGDDADASCPRRYHSVLYYVQPVCVAYARAVCSFHPLGACRELIHAS